VLCALSPILRRRVLAPLVRVELACSGNLLSAQDRVARSLRNSFSAGESREV